MLEEGFSTSTIFDSKNQDFLKEEKYIYIDKIEIYYTDDRIIGFFPLYPDRSANKKIIQNSCYNQIISKLKDIKLKLKKSGKELKKEIILLNEPLSNIKVLYDENSQIIKTIKFSTDNKALTFGSQNIDNKKKLSVLYKKDCFISGMKTCYLNSNDGIPNLSYIKCYFAKNELLYTYNLFKDKLNESSFCTKLILFPFKLCYSTFIFSIKIVFNLFKLLLILFLILSPPAYFYWKSQNFYRGEFEVTSLKDGVKIYTDEYGFPHIKSNNIEDAYFGLGFAQAKNRLWQIDMNRRIARGALSEILGNKTLQSDIFLRRLGINEYSIKQTKHVEENCEYLNILNAFIEGINYFGNNFKLPIEYYMTSSEFKNFTLTDMIASCTFFGLTMSQDYSMEVFMQYMEKKLGKEIAKKILRFKDIDFPFWNTTIISDEELKKLFLYKKKEKFDKKDEIHENENEIKPNGKKTNNENEKKENNDDVNSILGNKFQNSGASNCWNVDGSLTSSGKPLLCNDPHLPNGMPGLLFIGKIYLPDNVISFASVPGTPIMITGSNSYISWGVTTENTDNSDFCEELVQGESYIKDNKKYPLEITKEEILIKGSAPVEVEIQKTKNGPIFGKKVPGFLTLMNQDFESSLPLSLRVAFMKKNFDAFDVYIKISTAHSKNDFLPYKSKLSFPNINLHWITKDGEIGYDAVGTITVKNYKNRFCHGYTSEDEIIKEVPKNEMIRKYNPESGYIISANNRPASTNYLYDLSGHHNNFRAHRIEIMLEEYKKQNKKIDIDNAIKILNDVKDTNAEFVLPKYLEILEKQSTDLSQLKANKYYSMLKNWNFEMNYNSSEATVYSVLERIIGAELLNNELLSNEKFEKDPILNHLFYWHYVSSIIEKIYNGEKVDMKFCMDNQDNNCQKFLAKLFDKLDDSMKPYIEKDGSIRKWGEINFNYFPHISFDSIPGINLIFSKKKHAGGNRNTVKIARGPVNSNVGLFIGTQSPRIKFICDMKNPEAPYLTVSEGNGGNFVQEYYNNFDDKHEDAKLVKFENINFENVNNQERMITFKKN